MNKNLYLKRTNFPRFGLMWEPQHECDLPVFQHFAPQREVALKGKALDSFTEIANLHGVTVILASE